MTKEEKQKVRKEKREARKNAKSRSLFRDGFVSYTYLITLILFGIVGYFNLLIDSRIFNIPDFFYFSLLFFIFIFTLLLFTIQYKTYKLDFYRNINQNMILNKTKTALILIFNLIYSVLVISSILLPLKYLIRNNPISDKMIIKEVIANCYIIDDEDVILNHKRFKKLDDKIVYSFYLFGREEEINIRYNIKRIEKIEKNNYKQKLRIYLKKGHFDTYILQRYELLD